ncbi:GIY-YIG nuclease family protein [Zeaxanthinibacter enoshimensis]|uniref:GIY-YIG nuclease family protein n=1 Tax=Zeaxanthinibacter enoshimensis TaxID=392009 RepID=UPI00356461E3
MNFSKANKIFYSFAVLFASVAELVDLPAGRQARWKWNDAVMIWVYAIASFEKNYIYVGMTKDLESRFKRHSRGWEKVTKNYRPFVLIYQECCPDRLEGRKKEKYFKSGVGKEYLRQLRDSIIENTL